MCDLAPTQLSRILVFALISAVVSCWAPGTEPRRHRSASAGGDHSTARCQSQPSSAALSAARTRVPRGLPPHCSHRTSPSGQASALAELCRRPGPVTTGNTVDCLSSQGLKSPKSRATEPHSGKTVDCLLSPGCNSVVLSVISVFMSGDCGIQTLRDP